MRLLLVITFCLALSWSLPPPEAATGNGLYNLDLSNIPSATWAPAISNNHAFTNGRQAAPRASPPLSAHPGRSERLALAPGYWLLV